MSYKVIFLGDSGVGKTSIINRKLYNYYNHTINTTIGASFASCMINDKMLNIWDTAGQERFNSLCPLYCRNADVVVLCFTDHLNIEKWLKIANVPQPCNLILVKTKMDTHNSSVVDTFDGHPLYFVSSRTNINIDKLFKGITNSVTDTPIQLKHGPGVPLVNSRNYECCGLG